MAILGQCSSSANEILTCLWSSHSSFNKPFMYCYWWTDVHDCTNQRPASPDTTDALRRADHKSFPTLASLHIMSNVSLCWTNKLDEQ